jgi:hypothetical protein
MAQRNRGAVGQAGLFQYLSQIMLLLPVHISVIAMVLYLLFLQINLIPFMAIPGQYSHLL